MFPCMIKKFFLHPYHRFRDRIYCYCFSLIINPIHVLVNDSGALQYNNTYCNEKLDKDRFRRDLGGEKEAYQEIARRLGVLPEPNSA